MTLVTLLPRIGFFFTLNDFVAFITQMGIFWPDISTNKKSDDLYNCIRMLKLLRIYSIKRLFSYLDRIKVKCMLFKLR